MKKTLFLTLMSVCMLTYADAITVPCEYSDGTAKVGMEWKPGLIWADYSKNLLCWGSDMPGKDDELISDDVVISPKSKIKGYIIIGRVRGPAIWTDAFSKKYLDEVTVKMNIKWGSHPDEWWIWSFGTPPLKQEGTPTNKDIGVHCRMILSEKLVTFSVITEPGKTEYYMRVRWKDYRNLKLLIADIPARKFGLEPKWPYRDERQRKTLNW